MYSLHPSVSRFVRVSVVALTSFASHAAFAQLPIIEPTQRLKPPPDPTPGGQPGTQVQLGWAVAADGDTAIISVNQGRAAYAYRKSANGRWVYQAALEAPTGGFTGYGASLHGNTALIQGSVDSQNSAFVFHRSQGQWTLTQTLPSSGAVPWASQQIALTGSYAAIGDSSSNDCRGGVLIYDKVGAGSYLFNTNLLASNSEECSFYGAVVAANRNTVLSYGTGAGNAAVFVRDGGVWSEQAKIHYPNSDTDRALPFDGHRAILSTGSRLDTDPWNAIVFVRSNGVWSQEQTLQHPYDPNKKLRIPGVIDGDRLVVRESQGLADNKLFLFERIDGVWTATAEFAGAAPMQCGSTDGLPNLKLSLTGNTLFAACPTTATPNPVFDGRVLVYQLPN
jgi:hypothetical protein